MQETSALYKSITSGAYETEIAVEISGTTYGMDKLVSLTTSRTTLGDGTPKLGNAVGGELDVTLYGDSKDVPRAAVIRVYVRAVSKTTGDKSEWLPKGVYFVDTREQIADTLQIHGYDAILKAELPYPDSILEWPATDLDVVREIASTIDCEIDSRTVSLMTQRFPIQVPVQYVSDGDDDMSKVFTMRETLAGIAGLYGGVFISNDFGKLQLICPWSKPFETYLLLDENGNYITVGGNRILLG